MRGMTSRLQGAIGIGLLLGLGATACSSSGRPAATGAPPSSTTVPASVPASTATTSPSTTVGSTPPGSSATTAPAGPAQCATSALTGSLTGADGTAGSVYYQLVLTNSGSSTCVVEGYPGVSFVYGSQGQQVGAAAARTTGNVVPVTLSAGSSAHATLQITVASNYGTCGLINTDGLRVYPPDQLTSLLVQHNDQACSDTNDVTLHVGPLQA